MQLLSMWTFGFVAILTIVFFFFSYPVGRGVRTFWAWATGTEPPKEKAVVFWPLTVIVGILVSGFVQAYYDAGVMCHRYQQPLIPCTIQNAGKLPADR